MSVFGKHGVSASTPENILLGAGTYHSGLVFEGSAWKGKIIGATKGGGKVSIKGEIMNIELDGALVNVKGLAVKQGGKATIEANFAEISADIMKTATMFEVGNSDATGYTMLQDKPNITEGDYIKNFGFVGQTADGSKNIIVIFENALCVSGLEMDPQNKNNAVAKLVFDAYAENAGDLDTLPVKIYYPDLPTV